MCDVVAFLRNKDFSDVARIANMTFSGEDTDSEELSSTVWSRDVHGGTDYLVCSVF
jgi:hypothetical protein